jgi:hypothetical protein
LEAFAHLTKRPNGGIEAIFARPLELFTKLLNVSHFLSSFSSRLGGIVARVRHMYAAMHKISTQLLHRTKCRIIGWNSPWLLPLPSAVGGLVETLCLETGCD